MKGMNFYGSNARQAMPRSLVFELIRARFCTRGSLHSIIIISSQRSWVLLDERHTLFDVLREIWWHN